MDDVDLIFDWPEALALSVREERVVETTDELGARSYRSRNAYTLAWHARDRSVRVVDHRREVLEHTPPLPGVLDHQQILRFVEEWGPSFRVGDDGQVAGLMPGVAETLRALVLPTSPVPPAVEALLHRLTTDAVIVTTAHSLWNPIVGGLAGALLPSDGSAVRGVVDLQIPIVGVLGPHTLEMRIVGDGDGWVRVRTEIAPRPEAVARILEAQGAPGPRGARVIELTSSSSSEAEVRPTTLVPTHATVERRLRMRVATPGQEDRRVETYERRTWTFSVAGAAHDANTAGRVTRS